MPEIVEIPLELTCFQLPPAVENRLHFLLDRQDNAYPLSSENRKPRDWLNLETRAAYQVFIQPD
ncbi:hypothetical protein [Laspinema olomoucense]|uniref:Uncharacterized protein n=1 Tax=Laspinema olomoucense D3b TaxID=2953688 RepID=A0ABT2N917_9CYAN|nr:hypothetical protein [Laspinema sp. D3b]MCT7977870.1 hypothetical protein [Laspinema sp. D3b]